MVKVTKWDRKKKKEDRAKYRNEQAKIKYKSLRICGIFLRNYGKAIR